MKSFPATMVALLALSGIALAQQGSLQVEITTDVPVYRSGVDNPLVFYVTNHGSSPALIGPFNVTSQDTYLTVSQGGLPLQTIEPGRSAVMFWNRKDKNTGEFAPPGSYIIMVVCYSTPRTDISRTVALTPTGTLAGGSMFPLGTGNRWVYIDKEAKGDFPPAILTTEMPSTSGSWFQVSASPFGDGWWTLTGSTLPTAWFSTQSGQDARLVFRFGKAKDYTYTVEAGILGPDATNLRVGSTNATVTTRAGKFLGCYRLDGVGSTTAQFGSFWFAPGVGLVQYTRRHGTNPLQTLSLRDAKIRNTDGILYTVSGAYSQIWTSAP